MKWVYMLPCFLCFAVGAHLQVSASLELAEGENNKVLEIGKSYTHGIQLQKAESKALIEILEEAIGKRIQKLKRIQKEPLKPEALIRYEELKERRAQLQTEDKDLLNEQRAELDQLQLKHAESHKVVDNLSVFEELGSFDKKLESMQSKYAKKTSIIKPLTMEIQLELEEKRKEFLFRFSNTGRPLFHLLTSLGIIKGYLSSDIWKDETQVLFAAMEHVKNITAEVMDTIPIDIDGSDLHANLMAVMEGLLESNPRFTQAISSYILSLNREIPIAIGLSRRPDLEIPYILELSNEETTTGNLLYALGILPQLIEPIGGYQGVSKELEKEIRSRREALLVMKMIEVENIKERANRGHPLQQDISEDDVDDSSDSGSDHDNVSSDDAQDHIDGGARDDESEEVGGNLGHEDGNPSALVEDSDEREESEEDFPVHHVGDHEPAEAQEQEADPDEVINELSSGAHLRAFLKVKAQEIYAQTLEIFLESARSAKMSEISSSESWKLRFWKQAVHKGLLNIAQILPLIMSLEDQTILVSD